MAISREQASAWYVIRLSKYRGIRFNSFVLLKMWIKFSKLFYLPRSCMNYEGEICVLSCLPLQQQNLPNCPVWIILRWKKTFWSYRNCKKQSYPLVEGVLGCCWTGALVRSSHVWDVCLKIATKADKRWRHKKNNSKYRLFPKRGGVVFTGCFFLLVPP